MSLSLKFGFDHLDHSSTRGNNIFDKVFTNRFDFRPVATFRHEEAVASSFLVV